LDRVRSDDPRLGSNILKGSEIPACMNLITPEFIVYQIDLYYKGGVIKREEKVHV
jgi:hypothetical protein